MIVSASLNVRGEDGAAPPLMCYGPKLPTFTEATRDLSEDEYTLGRMRLLYRLTPQTLDWVSATLSRSSKEGRLVGTADFWLQRPHLVSPSNSA